MYIVLRVANKKKFGFEMMNFYKRPLNGATKQALCHHLNLGVREQILLEYIDNKTISRQKDKWEESCMQHKNKNKRTIKVFLGN